MLARLQRSRLWPLVRHGQLQSLPWWLDKKLWGAEPLSAAQRQQWAQEGFLVLPGFFSPARVAPVIALLDTLWSQRHDAANPLVIDVHVGRPDERRMYFRDAPDTARALPYKLNDVFLESALVRALILDHALVPVLAELLHGVPMACNSLTFERGSQQDFHFDTFYMPPTVKNRMVASWIALEDVQPEAGPLAYYPKSHLIPPYRFSHGKITAVHDEMPAWKRYIDAEVGKRGLTPTRFLAKAGDVFIWHAQLLHAGAPILAPEKTRKSVVTHYYRAEDHPPSEYRVVEDGRRIHRRGHQKV